MSFAYLATLILYAGLIYLTHQLCQVQPAPYIVCIVLMGLALVYLLSSSTWVIEHLDTNYPGLYNNDLLTVKNLTVLGDISVAGKSTMTGKLTAQNGIEATGNITADVIAGDLRHAHCGSYLSIKNNTCDENVEQPDWHRYDSPDKGVTLGWAKRYGNIYAK